MGKLQGNFDRWGQLPRGNADKVLLGRELVAGCDSVAWQVDELSNAVAIAEKNPQRFKLSNPELSSRKQWIKETRAVIEKVRIATAAEAEQAAASGYNDGRFGSPYAAENEEALQGEADNQSLLMRQQDEELEDLSGAVTRLGNIGLSISEELESQGNLIDEMGQETDSALARMRAASRKMEQVIKKSGMRGQCCIIITLVIILSLLVYATFH